MMTCVHIGVMVNEGVSSTDTFPNLESIDCRLSSVLKLMPVKCPIRHHACHSCNAHASGFATKSLGFNFPGMQDMPMNLSVFQSMMTECRVNA